MVQLSFGQSPSYSYQITSIRQLLYSASEVKYKLTERFKSDVEKRSAMQVHNICGRILRFYHQTVRAVSVISNRVTCHLYTANTSGNNNRKISSSYPRDLLSRNSGISLSPLRHGKVHKRIIFEVTMLLFFSFPDRLTD